MKKVLLALLSITIAFTAMQPSQAEDQKVLAIIDSAIDSTKFNSIIHEVCFTTAKSMACPNGELFMEGPKAAAAHGSEARPRPDEHQHPEGRRPSCPRPTQRRR